MSLHHPHPHAHPLSHSRASLSSSVKYSVSSASAPVSASHQGVHTTTSILANKLRTDEYSSSETSLDDESWDDMDPEADDGDGDGDGDGDADIDDLIMSARETSEGEHETEEDVMSESATDTENISASHLPSRIQPASHSFAQHQRRARRAARSRSRRQHQHQHHQHAHARVASTGVHSSADFQRHAHVRSSSRTVYGYVSSDASDVSPATTKSKLESPSSPLPSAIPQLRVLGSRYDNLTATASSILSRVGSRSAIISYGVTTFTSITQRISQPIHKRIVNPIIERVDHRIDVAVNTLNVMHTRCIKQPIRAIRSTIAMLDQRVPTPASSARSDRDRDPYPYPYPFPYPSPHKFPDSSTPPTHRWPDTMRTYMASMARMRKGVRHLLVNSSWFSAVESILQIRPIPPKFGFTAVYNAAVESFVRLNHSLSPHPEINRHNSHSITQTPPLRPYSPQELALQQQQRDLDMLADGYLYSNTHPNSNPSIPIPAPVPGPGLSSRATTSSRGPSTQTRTLTIDVYAQRHADASRDAFLGVLRASLASAWDPALTPAAVAFYEQAHQAYMSLFLAQDGEVPVAADDVFNSAFKQQFRAAWEDRIVEIFQHKLTLPAKALYNAALQLYMTHALKPSGVESLSLSEFISHMKAQLGAAAWNERLEQPLGEFLAGARRAALEDWEKIHKTLDWDKDGLLTMSDFVGMSKTAAHVFRSYFHDRYQAALRVSQDTFDRWLPPEADPYTKRQPENDQHYLELERALACPSDIESGEEDLLALEDELEEELFGSVVAKEGGSGAVTSRSVVSVSASSHRSPRQQSELSVRLLRVYMSRRIQDKLAARYRIIKHFSTTKLKPIIRWDIVQSLSDVLVAAHKTTTRPAHQALRQWQTQAVFTWKQLHQQCDDLLQTIAHTARVPQLSQAVVPFATDVYSRVDTLFASSRGLVREMMLYLSHRKMTSIPSDLILFLRNTIPAMAKQHMDSVHDDPQYSQVVARIEELKSSIAALVSFHTGKPFPHARSHSRSRRATRSPRRGRSPARLELAINIMPQSARIIHPTPTLPTTTATTTTTTTTTATPVVASNTAIMSPSSSPASPASKPASPSSRAHRSGFSFSCAMQPPISPEPSTEQSATAGSSHSISPQHDELAMSESQHIQVEPLLHIITRTISPPISPSRLEAGYGGAIVIDDN